MASPNVRYWGSVEEPRAAMLQQNRDPQQQQQQQPAPVLKRWLSVEEIFDKSGSRAALRWTLAFGVMLGLFALIAWAVAIAYKIPAWPTGPYNYGWVLTFMNNVTWILYIAVALMRNIELTQWTFGITVLQWVINVVVFVLQIIGGISNLINLNTDTNLFGIIISAILLVLSTVLFFSLLYLIIVIAKFRPPAASQQHRR